MMQQTVQGFRVQRFWVDFQPETLIVNSELFRQRCCPAGDKMYEIVMIGGYYAKKNLEP